MVNLDSGPLMASLTDASAFLENGIPNGTPTASVLNVDSTLPVVMRRPTIEFGNIFTHAVSRTEDARLALEIAGRTVKLPSTPCTYPRPSATPCGERFSRSPSICACFGTELLPFGDWRPAVLARFWCCPSPSVAKIAGGRAKSLVWPSILREVFGSAFLAVLGRSLGHNSIITQISEEYCRIARERIALVEAQPTLFEHEAEQMEIYGGSR